MGYQAGRIQGVLSDAVLVPESSRLHSCHMPHRWQNTVKGTARGYTGEGKQRHKTRALGC